MAFSIAFSNPNFSPLSSAPTSPLFSPLPQATTRRPCPLQRRPLIKALSESESDNSKQNSAEAKPESSSNAQPSASSPAATATPKRPQKPVYSMKKGQIVRVDKEKYLNSINYLSVGHPPYYKGLDYIYEDRGEVAWVGIPTAPAWLPTDMLIKSDKLDYERM